jgi:hypothetical protein
MTGAIAISTAQNTGNDVANPRREMYRTPARLQYQRLSTSSIYQKDTGGNTSNFDSTDCRAFSPFRLLSRRRLLCHHFHIPMAVSVVVVVALIQKSFAIP